jgi:PEP-CTERM motif
MTSRTATKWMLGITFTAIAGLISAPQAQATANITFDQAPDNEGGTITYATVGGTLVGTDIIFDSIAAAGTSADGPYDCQTCRLNFTSGNNTNPGPGIYQWAGGGSFVLTGGSLLMGIDPGWTVATCADDGDDSDCVATTVLLSGSFTSLPGNVGVGLGTTFSFLSNGVDIKNADMAAFLGIDPLHWTYSESNFSLGTATFNPDGTFSGAVTQADLQNIKAPEPASSLLLLLGIGSLLAYRRKQQ